MSLPKLSSEEFSALVAKSTDELATSLIPKTNDDLTAVMQFHLHVERLLERIILAVLVRGDILLKKGRLTFSQKIRVVESFDLIPDKVMSSIKNLNSLRNKCAHVDFDYITAQDLDRIGNSLGSEFRRLKKESPENLRMKLFALVATPLISKALTSEYEITQESLP